MSSKSMELCLREPRHQPEAIFSMAVGLISIYIVPLGERRTRLSDFTFTFHFHAFGEGNGNPLQCSCLENPRDGGAWWAAVYGVAKSWTRLK